MLLEILCIILDFRLDLLLFNWILFALKEARHHAGKEASFSFRRLGRLRFFFSFRRFGFFSSLLRSFNETASVSSYLVVVLILILILLLGLEEVQK